MRPLSGVRIVGFTQFLLGPAAVQYLSDLGAEVYKIEPLEGAFERRWTGSRLRIGELSGIFGQANRNVRSVAVDLKDERGRDAVKRLIRTADVLVENYRPGVMDRLGLGADAVRSLNPGIVYASASGFDPDGPDRDLPGQDLLIQAASGLMSLTGRAGGPPVPTGTPIVDQHSATLLAMGILAALVRRSATGEGAHVHISMLRAALDLQTEPMTHVLNGQHLSRPQSGIGSAFHDAPYGVYPTADGYLALSIAPLERLGAALRSLGHDPGLLPQESSFSGRDEIWETLSDILVERSASEWEQELRERGIWCARVNATEEVFASGSIDSESATVSFDLPGGAEAHFLAHPLRFDGVIPQNASAPPSLGEHTIAALSEAGIPDDELETLLREGVIRG